MNFKKYFCCKKKIDSKTSIILVTSDNCQNLYNELYPYRKNFKEFLSFFLNFSKEKENENLIALENLIDENIFTKTLLKFDKIILLENLNQKNYNEDLYNSIFNYINYLSLKSSILIYESKWNIFRIKKILQEKNTEKFIKILTKKINFLFQINNFLKTNLISEFFFETISKTKRKKLFIKCSLKIFKLILLFSMKIKHFKETQKSRLSNLLQKKIEINEYFSYLNKKRNQNFKISKIDQITNFYLLNILQNLRYYILDNNLEDFQNNLKTIFNSLLMEFPEETENLINEISSLILKSDINLSTIYEESHYSTGQSCNDSSGSINKLIDKYYGKDILLNVPIVTKKKFEKAGKVGKVVGKKSLFKE